MVTWLVSSTKMDSFESRCENERRWVYSGVFPIGRLQNRFDPPIGRFDLIDKKNETLKENELTFITRNSYD